MGQNSPHKVLLIDDDPIQLRIREALLHAAGVEVSVATAPSSALALLRSPFGCDIGLVVTDHIMPEASGSEFVRNLRQFNRTMPVIVVSGLAEAEEEYHDLNVIFRPKPCAPAELIRLVRSTLPRAA